MNVTGSLSIVVDLIASKTIATGLIASVPVRKTFAWSIANGTGADQANELYVAERTVGSGATDSLDFSGTLEDLFGDTFVLAKLKALIIGNRAGSTTNLTVQRPAGAVGVPLFLAVSDALAPLTPGNAMCVWYRAAAGIGVTAATADIIEVVNSAGASNTYDIIAIGTDA
jgi:hypothetical protein